MATKQDFTEQEWASLERGISGTGTAGLPGRPRFHGYVR